LAENILPHVGGLKLGLEFFNANGPDGVRMITALGRPLFLDLKLHDIPNTVAGGIRSAAALGPAFITIHASGGPAMMRAAADAATRAAEASGIARPRLLGVTVLTSLDGDDLAAVGQDPAVADQVDRLAALARECGLDGVICAPPEIARLRKLCGGDFTLMVPGIRPAGSDSGDQKRVMTPEQAMAQGADHLVIGRSITRAADPALAARGIADGLLRVHS
jgi:orotidine-5'-phosphate decarboxylase